MIKTPPRIFRLRALLMAIVAAGAALPCCQEQPPPLFPLEIGKANLTPVRIQRVPELQLPKRVENRIIRSPANDADDQFGASLALTLNTLVVGAPNTKGGGAVWVFDLSQPSSSPSRLIPPHLQDGDACGASVAIAPGGDFIAVGAPNSKVGGRKNVGVVHVWKKSETEDAWIFDGTYSWDDLEENSRLGTTVGIGRDTLLAGAPFAPASTSYQLQTAPFEEDEKPQTHYRVTPKNGAVATWMRIEEQWVADILLQPEPMIANAQFGGSLFLEGPQALIGASSATASDQIGAGKAYIFLRANSGWRYEPICIISQTGNSAFKGDQNTISGNGPAHHFGGSVCILANIAMIGTPADSESHAQKMSPLDAESDAESDVHHYGTWPKCGSVNLYQRIDTAWRATQYIFAGDRQANDAFGSSVAIAGTQFVIGAPNKSLEGHATAGAVYVFQILKDSIPIQEEFVVQLVPARPVVNSLFGASLACTPDIIAVAAPGKAGPTQSGQVFLFQRMELNSQTSWGLEKAKAAPVDISQQQEIGRRNPSSAP